MTIQEILEMLSKGELTADAANKLLDKLRTATAGKVPTEDKEGYKTADEYMADLTSVLDMVKNTPEGQAQIRDAVAGRKEERFIKRYSPFFNALLAGADVISSLKQVRQSNEALKTLRRPSLPAVPGLDPALDNAIRNAEVGTMDAARAIGPARQELQDQYAKDLAVAKSVGGGQASTLGAMNQVASMRRARGVQQLAPQVDAIRAREQGRLDNLLRLRMQHNNQNYYNRFRNSQIEFDQYNRDVAAAGQLGAIGRTNVRNAAQSLINQVPRVAARLNRGYEDRYDSYENVINRNLLRNIQPKQAPVFTPGDIYGDQTPLPVEDNYQSNVFFNPYS